MKKIFLYHKKNIFPYLLGITFVNCFLRIIFIFYGYIATEEGTSIYNQRRAWEGFLPFIDYDGWNSLLNDYLVGWYQFFLPHTILMQRFVGLGIALLVFFLTLHIARSFKSKTIILLTAVCMTFGSYTYLYLSTIPYSEQTMTFFIILSLYFLSKNLINSTPKISWSIFTGIFILVATINRIQALPSAIILIMTLLYMHRKKPADIFKLLLSIFVISTLIIFPFLFKGPDQFFYSLIWPLYADRILIYQQNTQITLTSFILYLQEVFRDYGIFIFMLIPGSWSTYHLWREKTQKNTHLIFITLLLLISYSFVATSFLHKPPYASYLYPGVPLFSLITAYFLDDFGKKLPSRQKAMFGGIFVLMLIQNFVLFYHFRFIKTARSTITKTPHTYLSEIADYVKLNSDPNDEIISLYTPILITAQRNIIPRLSRDRFSLSILPEDEAQRYHLMSEEFFVSYIREGKTKMIILTDKTKNYLGKTENDRKKTMQLIEENYTLIKEFPEVKFIEDPKTSSLFIYLKKI